MELGQAIYDRRATRAYTSEPVDKAVLEALVDAAIQAPSANNLQPWAFCVVRDAALLDHISNEAKALIERGASLHPHMVEMLGKPNFQIFYQAPALILICAADDSEWSHVDCTLAAQNLMLAAHGKGLGSCWIGMAQSWLESDEGMAALNLPAHWTPVAPIIIGHPSGTTPATPRNTPELHWCG